MLIRLPTIWIVLLNALGWPVVQVGLAWAFTRMPAAWFNPGPAARWERSGAVYDRLFGIRGWKDLLPDGARWFGGGFAKGNLRGRGRAYLERFIRETWRGELCHWLALAFVPVFCLWNPWWGDLVIAAYALGANLPCILAQRYNRIRLARLLAGGTRPATKDPAAASEQAPTL